MATVYNYLGFTVCNYLSERVLPSRIKELEFVPHDKTEENDVSPRMLELLCKETSKVEMERGVKTF
jgi:hypothetical protein